VRRVAATPAADVVTTVISVDESLSGWYAVLRQARRPADVERAYARLAETVLFFTGLTLLNYTQPAMARFDQLLKLKLNVGKNDLRIATIAQQHGAVVVTRNLSDFSRVPGLLVEDWTTPPPG
jgi:tRNA(fMet)-specific endonuclease VapC